ncbi:hypothetical protein WICMUC_005942 [Wickerhamomyces mucosus]|uniref:Uncharacterized protein n=1 Tax=Wickerhamomyces mucosus TaxID=1378264 RepID=A0A9P8P1S5_9ASCO|nr:hypothetical protein WICMUC_005942 [Wickerhamomyces mucosus]
MTFTANSIPARIRHSGIHQTNTLYKENNILYLRGYKLTTDDNPLKLQGKGILITKEFDDFKKIADITEIKWFEREGEDSDIHEKINELYKLSEIIHE